MNQDIERLRYTSLFRGASVEDLGKILKNINLQVMRYKKGSVFLLQNQEYNDLFIIVDGVAKAEMIDYTGKNIKIEELKTPYVVASAILFADENLLPVSVTATTDVTVIIIKREDIFKLFNLDKRYLSNFLSDLSNKFMFITKRMSFIGLKSIKEKLASYLLSLKKDQNDFVRIPFTLEELSDYLGITRPSLSRSLIELEKDGIIERDNKMVKILDIDRLLGL